MADATSTALPAALRDRTGFALTRLASTLRRQTADELAALGVGQHQHAILCCLSEFGPSFQKDVAARLGIDTGDLVGLVEGLDRGGLIARDRDPRDRRRQILQITPAGTRTLAEVEAALDRAESETLTTLSSQEQRQLHGLASRVLSERTPASWPLAAADPSSEPVPSGATTRPLPGVVHVLTALPRAAIGLGRSFLSPIRGWL